MLEIPIVQDGFNYLIGGMNVGDEESLLLLLRAKGVTEENIRKALEEAKRQGASTIRQE